MFPFSNPASTLQSPGVLIEPCFHTSSPLTSKGGSNFGCSLVPWLSATAIRPSVLPMIKSNSPSPFQSAANGATAPPELASRPNEMLDVHFNSAPGFHEPELEKRARVPLRVPAMRSG